MDAAAVQAVSWVMGSADGSAKAGLTQVFPFIYEDLRRVAERYMGSERAQHTLQPTALVHEAFVRLRARDHPVVGEGHALAMAAIVMRSILVDHARQRLALKRGGDAERFSLRDEDGVRERGSELDLLELDDLITKLATLDERRARVVELRVFAGMSNDDIAEVLGVARSTVSEDWRVARAWLGAQIGKDQRR